MRLFFLFCLVIFQLSTNAQNPVYRKDAPKSSLKLYESGVDAYRINLYEKAKTYFEKALNKSPGFIDAELQLASVCFDLNDFSCAEIHFQNVIRLDSLFNKKVFYTLALTQYQLDKFHTAEENLSNYLSSEIKNPDLLSKAKLLMKSIHFADSATTHPVEIKPMLLQSLNSEFSEYMPTLTADGKTAVFNRRNFHNDEDLYITYYSESDWSEPQPIAELNSPENEGSPALSPDGHTLIFTICNNRFSLGGCDLYISDYIDEHWSEPFNLGENINTSAYESNACFADNGNSIYFCSNRKGTIGGYDLWVSKRKKDHSWSVPKNLGPTINTPGNEVSPFMHPNGITLYFSSDYPPGMGGRDLFYSTQDETGNWKTPINLGYPVNSKGDESSFIVFPDGKKAWMASDKKYFQNSQLKNYTNLDLYEMFLPSSLQVKPATYVQINVTDSMSGKPIKSHITVFDLSNNKKFYDGYNYKAETLLISLPTGADYGLHIYNKDYLFIPEQFQSTEEKKQYDPLIINKKLIPIDHILSRSTILKNIFFETGSAILRKESKFELDAMISFLNDNPDLQLKITGYTDDVGQEKDNLLLSEQRALSVINYLQSHGIQKERLQSEGKGETNPIDNNQTETGRQNNRRIEFSIRK
jgi:outer membrane protein OmpA-like peptidoglycan-associated protein/tetratricopeptide (TPR) repeat protein